MTKKRTLEEWKSAFIGRKFGRLTILDLYLHYRESGKRDGYEVMCKCDCGNIKATTLHSILKGHTQSCGCLSKERRKEGLEKWRKENPEKYKNHLKKMLEKAHQWIKENPDKFKESSKRGLDAAHVWLRENPEKMKENLKKATNASLKWKEDHPEEYKLNLEKATKNMLQWCEEHPDERKALQQENIKRFRKWEKEHPEEAKLQRERNLDKGHKWWIENNEEAKLSIRNRLCKQSSKEEKEIYDYLATLGLNIERQFILEGNFFDFKINNFLIEYNGASYHYTKFENLENLNSKPPRTDIKDKDYHSNKREIAIRNGYRLIQVWDYEWMYKKNFIKKLIKEQLFGIAEYKDYLNEKGLLNNDYGFDVEGEFISSNGLWVSTYKKFIVEESYTKGKMLVYNSGYTKVF